MHDTIINCPNVTTTITKSLLTSINELVAGIRNKLDQTTIMMDNIIGVNAGDSIDGINSCDTINKLSHVNVHQTIPVNENIINETVTNEEDYDRNIVSNS